MELDLWNYWLLLQNLSINRIDTISENKIFTDIQAKLVHTEKYNCRGGKHEILYSWKKVMKKRLGNYIEEMICLSDRREIYLKLLESFGRHVFSRVGGKIV